MKKGFVVSILCTFILAPATVLSAEELSAIQKLKIEKEIDSTFVVMVNAAESLDVQKLSQGVDDRHNSGFIAANNYFTHFDSLMANFVTRSQGIVRQNIAVQTKKITALSESLALLTATGSSKVDLHNGNSFTVQFFWSFVYEKSDGSWKVIQSHQSNNR